MYFDGVSTSDENDVEALAKALEAGYGTDSATIVNGRALIAEDLESTVLNVVAQTKEDCKVLNTLKKTPAKSTVHEFNRRTDHGDWKHLSVPEGGSSRETNQAIERATVRIKYLQTRRSVTKQMEVSDTFEGAYASEKISGVETITKGLEYMIFHGDSSVIPTEFDGFLATLKKSEKSTKFDMRGNSIGASGYGEKVFHEIARQVYEKNGDLDKVMFPSVLAEDILNLFSDRLRYTPLSNDGSFVQFPAFTTAIGSTLRFTGEDAGADKFFKVKGKVVADGSSTDRPKAPTSVTAQAAADPNSKFKDSDAGDYMYTVHAVNANGTSEGKSIDAAVAVAAGNKVTLTITKAADGPVATGYIICRSKKDGTEVMEMDSIPASSEGTTTYVDINEELPGTASMIFLPKTKITPAYDLAQLLPVCTMPVYPTDKAETPFLVMAYAALAVKAPEHLALAKNIAYQGGLY